jgi:cytochrome c-type protein NapC
MLKKTKSWLARYSPITILVVGVIGGILFWGGFNTAMEATNTETFCVSCHEMEVNVFKEYKNTIHYNNRTGVRATCPDCHVPKDWVHKFVRKVKATNELYHKAVGSIDTPEKFNAKRLQLAQNVWRSMKATDSRECRNCHDNVSMDYTKQGRRAVDQHQRGVDQGMTCIDCHKGIAHALPDMSGVDPSAVLAVQEE